MCSGRRCSGITVGALPGLTATLGVALLTTLTFHMPAERAILVLVCMYVGAIYGGSRSAILLNIPGTPASAATSLDGFPLARSGHAGRAMGLATSGSFLGSLIGMLALALIAPELGEIALSFKSPEFFWLALFGVLISGQITTTGDSLKGWIAGVLGLLVAMVGQEGIHAYQRFSYGWTDISGGIDLLPALVGAFGFAEIIGVMKARAYVHGADRDRPGHPEAVRDLALQAHHRPLRADRHPDGPPSRRGRGHGRVDVLCRRPARQSRAGARSARGRPRG